MGNSFTSEYRKTITSDVLRYVDGNFIKVELDMNSEEQLYATIPVDNIVEMYY